MRVWPVLLILSACGTSVSTSPANPTSDDQVVTEPDATPAEIAIEAAVAPDARLDSGSDAPREVAPDAPAPDVAQDSADASEDAPEAWVWRPRDAGREVEAEASPPEPLVVPIDVSVGSVYARSLGCSTYEHKDIMVDVVLPDAYTSYVIDADATSYGCCRTGDKYGTGSLCSSWADADKPGSSADTPLAQTDDKCATAGSSEHVLREVPVYYHFPAGKHVVIYVAQSCGVTRMTGTVTFR